MPPKKSNNINSNKKKVVIESTKSSDEESIDQDDYDTDSTLEETTSDELSDDESTEETDVLTSRLSENEDQSESEEASEEEPVESDNEESEEEVEEADDECLYKKAKVKNFDADEEDELELIYDDDDLNYNEIVKSEDRITKPFMTVFERVRLLGDRAKQLSLGAKPMIKDLETMMNPKEIAKLELEKGVIPLIIERVLPNGKKERWRVNELKIIN